MLSSNELDPVGLEGVPATELDAPGTPETKALHALWLGKFDGKKLPSRSDFSPIEMKEYLGHIYIIEVIDDGADFLVRLAGTALTGMFGDDFTGAIVIPLYKSPFNIVSKAFEPLKNCRRFLMTAKDCSIGLKSGE